MRHSRLGAGDGWVRFAVNMKNLIQLCVQGVTRSLETIWVCFISVETLDLGGLSRAFACPKAPIGAVFEPENTSHQTSEVLPNSFETHPNHIVASSDMGDEW